MIEPPADRTLPSTGGHGDGLGSETFVQWLLGSPSEDAVIRDLAAFVRAAESAPRSGSPSDLKDWIREHGSPAWLDQLDEAGRLWSIRRRVGA